MVYGRQKINYNIDGIELLAKAEGTDANLAMTRILDDKDHKKIKLLKMRQAIKDVAGLKSDDEEAQEEVKEKKKRSASFQDESEDLYSDLEDEDGEEFEEDSGKELNSDDEGEDFEDSEDEGESIEEDESGSGQEEGSNVLEIDEEEEEEIVNKSQKPKSKSKNEEEKILSKRKKRENEVDELIDLSEDIISSKDLEELDDISQDSDNQANPHGFIWAHNLDTYKKSKRDRLAE